MQLVLRKEKLTAEARRAQRNAEGNDAWRSIAGKTNSADLCELCVSAVILNAAPLRCGNLVVFDGARAL